MYGKEITLTLEDALISMESLRLMMGGQLIKPTESSTVTVHCSEQGTATKDGEMPTLYDHLNTTKVITLPSEYRFINLSTGVRGTQDTVKEIKNNDKIRVFWTEKVTEESKAVEISISPSTFPGTYKIVGETYIRDTDGKDDAFQFVINKAKVGSEVTITMEADGDPSTNIQMWK